MRRIPSLDGLRAISILLVLVGHWFTFHHPTPRISLYAATGVQIFFVISGYLITGLLLSERSRTETICLRKFYFRRAYRILPAASVFVLVISAIYRPGFRYVALCLTYLLNYSPTRPWFLGHLWTLCNEEQFYLLWPSALRRYFRYRVPILLSLTLISPIYVVTVLFLKLPRWMVVSPFPAVMDVIAVGCLLAIYAEKIPAIPGWVAGTLLLVVIMVPQFAGDSPAKTVFYLFVLRPALNFSIAGLVLHVVQRPYRFLNIAPVTWFGRISYSCYLWQQPFFFASASKPVWYPALGIVLACLSYYLVEQPILRYRDRSIPRARTAHA